MRNIIFIAPPAAGKGTISEKLIDKYGYKHISTGNILRDMANRNDEFGHNLKEMLSSGKLVPDEIVYEALKRRLLMNDLDDGYILDGFPRNLNQAFEFKYPMAFTLKDENIFIIHSKGIDICDSLMTTNSRIITLKEEISESYLSKITVT